MGTGAIMLTKRQKEHADRLDANHIDWRQIAKTIGATYTETSDYLGKKNEEDHDLQALRKTHDTDQPTLL